MGQLPKQGADPTRAPGPCAGAARARWVWCRVNIAGARRPDPAGRSAQAPALSTPTRSAAPSGSRGAVVELGAARTKGHVVVGPPPGSSTLLPCSSVVRCNDGARLEAVQRAAGRDVRR